jgi:hypothetical protein
MWQCIKIKNANMCNMQGTNSQCILRTLFQVPSHWNKRKKQAVPLLFQVWVLPRHYAKIHCNVVGWKPAKNPSAAIKFTVLCSELSLQCRQCLLPVTDLPAQIVLLLAEVGLCSLFTLVFPIESTSLFWNFSRSIIFRFLLLLSLQCLIPKESQNLSLSTGRHQKGSWVHESNLASDEGL